MLMRLLLCVGKCCKVHGLLFDYLNYIHSLGLLMFLLAMDQCRTYTPSLEDVGSYLILYWVPTRADGKLGDPVVAVSDSPVTAGHLSFLSMISSHVLNVMLLCDSYFSINLKLPLLFLMSK